jgi:IS605 OrfB family transposase
MEEHDRIENRLHEAANRLVRIAEVRKSAIVLEDLTGLRLSHWSKNRKLNRRLRSWPRRKHHQYIEYKAEWAGVPVVKVDPGYTSRTCPVCGRIDKDSRKDRVFRCACGWECDRHVNAGLNIVEKAMASNGDVARAVQGRPDEVPLRPEDRRRDRGERDERRSGGPVGMSGEDK